MEEEYSRRKKPRVKPRKNNYFFVILFLMINLAALSYLLFLNVQAESKFDQQLTVIEKYVSQLDQQVASRIATVTPTSTPLPKTGQITENSSIDQTEASTTTASHQTVSEESTSASAIEEETTPTVKPEVVAATSYTVQAGDSLSVIAEKNNLSLQELMTKNNLIDSTVYVGQVLSLR